MKKIIFIFPMFIITSLFGCNKNEDAKSFRFADNVQQISETEYKCTVSNQTEIIDINDLITDSENSKFYITTIESDNKIEGQVLLNEGDNYFKINFKKQSLFLDIYRLHLYTVSFNTNWEISIDSVQIEENQTITPQIISRPGYSCSWDFDFSKPIVESFTANAIYTPMDYTIYLDGTGGNVTPNEITVTYTNNFTLPIPTYPGYEFIGWKDVAGNTVESGKYLYTSDVTLYATWQLIYYSITYDFQGINYQGSLITSYTVRDSVELPSLSKVGYDFLGWEDQNGTYFTSTIPTGTVGNLSLTARLNAKTYTVTFRLLGGYCVDEGVTLTDNLFKSVKCDDLISEPFTPYHKTELFDGWYLGDKKWDFNNDKMPFNNITLDAKYYIPDCTDISSFEYEYNSQVRVYEYSSNYNPTETKSGYLITKYIGTDSDIRIPDTINGTPVIGLADQSFVNTNIKQVYLGNNIVYLGKRCLAFCNNLINVVFTASKYWLDSLCLYKSNNIRNIYFPNTSYFSNSISTCANIVNIWTDNPKGWQGDGPTAFYNLKNLKNLYINSNFFSFSQSTNASSWISECGVFNLYFSGSIIDYLKCLKWTPLDSNYYLYIYGELLIDFTFTSTSNWWGDEVIALSTCLNDFGTITFNNFNDPRLSNLLLNSVQCIKYTNYKSQNYGCADEFSNCFMPKYLFIPNNLSYFNLSIRTNQSSVVIPNNIDVIDNCKGFKCVFIDRDIDDNLDDSFGNSVVYWRGQWHFDNNGLPVSN